MEIDHDDYPEEPTVITSHLAYFFLPLPDPLGVPDKYTFQALQDTPPDRIQEEELPPVCVGASLCFHRAELPTADAKERTVLFDLAATALPHTADESAHSAQIEDSVEEPGAPAPESRVTTVVEMAVAVGLSDVDESMPEEELDIQFRDELTEAFDQGLEYIRQFQRAYYLMRREPIRLVTRETLPFAVPFGVRRLYDDDGQPLPFEVPLSVYLLNMNVPMLDATAWGDRDSDTLNTAIDHQVENGPFASYLDLVRESHVALSRDGAYRSAVLFTATACEALFDDLLAHMIWEEGKRPEDAASLFDSQLTPRVKSRYHGRLGGSWTLVVLG